MASPTISLFVTPRTSINLKKQLLKKITKISAVIWIICIIVVFSLLDYVVGVRKEMFDQAPDVFAFSVLGFVVLGILMFLLGLTTLTAHLLRISSKKRQNIFLFLPKLFFTLTVLPIYLAICTFKSSTRPKKILSRLASLVLIIFLILPIWAGGYFAVASIAKDAVGFGTDTISISGTGSMYPTFPKGQGKTDKELSQEVVGSPGMISYPNGILIRGKRYFGHQIARGDIVVVENDKTRALGQEMYGRPSGWVKRIIGMPLDSLELRDGIVYINDQKLVEAYTAQAHSTFGEGFLSECKKVSVPTDSIFVMGDNRKGSGDSREIGFIKVSDINHVLPLKDQVGVYDKAWRDTSNDFEESSKTKLDKTKYLAILNEKRKAAGVKELKYQPKLEVSAAKRAQIIIKYDDFSFEATQSGYTMARAMRDAKYSNIVYGEAPTQGYFDETELIGNQFEFPETSKFLTDKSYQEVGIAEVEGMINGCPAQVIVQHFAGYVPPNYKPDLIESWRAALSSLRGIQSSWQKVKEWGSAYEKNKSDYDRINDIISLRISNIQNIVTKMEKNQWLSDSELEYTKRDEVYSNEQNSLADKLNSL